MANSERRRNLRGKCSESIHSFLGSGLDQSGFEVVYVNETIGYGVFPTKRFEKGDFLLEYAGEKISLKEAAKREVDYKKEKKGCFIYYNIADSANGKFCVDATYSNQAARYVNDSPLKLSNVVTKRLVNTSGVYIALFALKDIEARTEIRYDYGDNPDDMPWRSKKENLVPIKLPPCTSSITPCILQKSSVEKNSPKTFDNDDQSIEFAVSDNYTLSKVDPLNSVSQISEDSEDSDTESVVCDIVKASATSDEKVPNKDADCLVIKHVLSSDVEEDSITNESLKNPLALLCKENPLALCKNPIAIGVTQRNSRKKGVYVNENYTDISGDEDVDDECKDPNFVPEFSDCDLSHVDYDDAIDTNLEKAIQRITDRCIEISGPLSSSPKHLNEESLVVEKTILNDTGVGLGESIGEILDTDDNGDIDNRNDSSQQNDVVDKIAEKKPSKPKIHRPCPYCGKMQSALTRHMEKLHKDEPEIIKAISLTRRERIDAFDRLRKEGIYRYNKKEMAKENPSYLRERNKDVNDSSSLIICSDCKGCYSKKYKARHQLHCGRNSGQVMIPAIPVESLVVNEMSKDFRNVMNKMIVDDVSTMAKTDSVILAIGSRIYNGEKCKTEKIYEVEKRVRLSMRLLSRLYIQFTEFIKESPPEINPKDANSTDMSNDASDMFRVSHVKYLIQSIQSLSEGENSTKCGLKIQIQNLIKEAGKIIEAHYLVEGKNMEAHTVSEFMKVFGVLEHEVFRGALYQLRQKRNKTTRKPANLPDADVVGELNQYLKDVTSPGHISFELPATIFVGVRDATCARLTIFNGRRGGEPARLFLYQWKEALDGVWLRPETRETYHREIDTGNRITFQEGKGNRQVPVFFPPDLVEALNFLCSEEIRKELNVADSNKYVFPSTQGSNNHVSGWHALMNCCKSANLEGKVNGTMNRHRVSSMIGALGLPESEQQLAFDHFGHSGDVNRNIYQTPQAERQLAATGRYLQLIDTNTSAESASSSISERPAHSNIAYEPSTASPSASEGPTNSNIAHGLSSALPSTRKRPTDSNSGVEPSSPLPEDFAVDTQTFRSKRPRIKQRVESDTSTSDNSESEEDLPRRASFRWSESIIAAFNDRFNGFIDRTEKRAMPSKGEMIKFLEQNNQDAAPFTVVRTRINNERSKVQKRLEKRRKDFNI